MKVAQKKLQTLFADIEMIGQVKIKLNLKKIIIKVVKGVIRLL